MSEELVKESIEGEREGHKGEVAHFTFTAHKAKQMRERFSSSLVVGRTAGARDVQSERVVSCLGSAEALAALSQLPQPSS